MKKKIFLGAYLNLTNAQNLNCLMLAKFLDREKYTVYALQSYNGNLNIELSSEVNLFTCFYPHRISKYIGYFWGIFHCDIAYLPKGELLKWNMLLLKLFKKKNFITIEGNPEKNANFKHYQSADKLYAITQHIRTRSMNMGFPLDIDKKILYLGVDTNTFANSNKQIKQLTDIIFVGRLKEQKGLFDVLILTKAFPKIKFHIVGDGIQKERLALQAKMNDLDCCGNITLHGILNHSQLAKLLGTCQLHVFPSRYEGFPKVILETAAASVPSLLYPEYGANEWITHMHNGFIVNTCDDMVNTVKMLIDDPELLSKIAKNASKSIQRFDWKALINHWEEVIDAQ